MKKIWYAVKLGHTQVTYTALVDKSRTNNTMLTGNAAFPTPNPTLVAFATATDRLDKAIQNYDFSRSRLDREERDLAFAELKAMRADLGGYPDRHEQRQPDRQRDRAGGVPEIVGQRLPEDRVIDELPIIVEPDEHRRSSTFWRRAEAVP